MIRHLLLSPAIVAALAVGLTSPLAAEPDLQTRRAQSAMPDTAAIQTFLYTAYPEFLQQALTFVFTPSGTAKAVTVTEAINPVTRDFRPVEPLLTATVELAADGQLVSYVADGRYLASDRNRALRAVLSQHPEWTDADVQVWLGAAGAAPRPTGDEAARIASYLGTAAEQSTPTLRLREPAVRGVTPPPGWRVDVSTTARDGRAQAYQLQFEPITGRLIAAVRQ